MPKLQLTLKTLDELDDGTIGELFERAMAAAVKDCISRPTDGKARKVSVVISVIPCPDTTGKATPGDVVTVFAEVFGTVPKKRTKDFTMRPNVAGLLTFRPDDADHPDADKLYDHVDPKTGEVKD